MNVRSHLPYQEYYTDQEILDTVNNFLKEDFALLNYQMIRNIEDFNTKKIESSDINLEEIPSNNISSFEPYNFNEKINDLYNIVRKNDLPESNNISEKIKEFELNVYPLIDKIKDILPIIQKMKEELGIIV
jgi:hypothetical protein